MHCRHHGRGLARHFARWTTDDAERRFARSPDDHHEGGRRHGREGGRHGGRSSLGRFFAHGDLRLVILHLVAEKPRHGYELIKAIEEQVGGAYSPSPGVIYPTLTLLEEVGQVTVSAAEGGKKLHAITPEGQSYLDAHRAGLEALLARMAEASQTHRRTEAPQLVRAMENLRLALRLRVARGPLDTAQLEAIAAALDTAAQQIERS